MDEMRLLRRIAEQNRSQLPHDFIADLDIIRAAVAKGEWPDTETPKGGRQGIGKMLREAVFAELYEFLCTDTPKYRDVRSKAPQIGQAAVAAMAGYVAKAVDVHTGAATGAVAFTALLVLKLGVNMFCRIGSKRIHIAHS